MLQRGWSWVGGGFLVVVGLAGLWAWHVYSQRLQLEEQNRRELAYLARELGAILSELSATADRYFKRETPEDERLEGAQEWAWRNPYIPTGSPVQAGSGPCLERGEAKGAGLVSPRRLALPSWFTVRNRVLELEVNAAAIFEDVALSEAFEYLFIADRTGTVMLSVGHGAAGRRRTELSWLDRRAKQESEREHLLIRIDNLAGIEAAGGQLNPELLATAGGSRSIRLGDQAYQLYSHPFEITEFRDPAEGGCSVEKANWIVGGLVDPAHMWQEAVTISPQWTFLLFLLFVVAVVGQPFVKLFLLSPAERFRFADACLLLPSAVFVLLLATILLLDAGAFGRLRSLEAGGLELLAQRAEDSLVGEFREMRNQLAAYDREAARRITPASAPPQDIVHLLSGKPGEPNLLREAPVTYRDFAQIFWVDAAGRQIFKATAYGSGTPRVSVAMRPYFTEPRDGHLWSFAGENGEGVFVQSFRSITTADLSTGLSIRSAMSKEGQPVVAVMSGRPVSVDQPLLPAGRSFAVIGADGRALYHSDRRRTLKENLYEEVSDPERLYAAVQAGTPQHFTTTYSRRRTEVFIRPLDSLQGARWFVVALADKQWLDTVNSEALLRAVLWSLVPLAAPVLAGLGILFAGRKRLGCWWPDADKAGLYQALAKVYVALLVVGLAGVALLSGTPLFVWAAGFPLLVAALTLAVCLRWVRSPERWETPGGRRQYRSWYVAALVGIWAVTAIPPGAGLFRHSWDLELAKLERFEQERARQYERDWQAREMRQAERIDVAGLEEFLRDRTRYFETYRVALAESAAGPGWSRLLDRYLPLYSEASQRLRYVGEKGDSASLRAAGEPRNYSSAGVALSWEAILGAVAALLGAWLWLRYKVRYMFWVHLAGSRGPMDPAKEAAENPFVVFLTPSEREERTVAARLKDAGAALVDDLDSAILDEDSRREALQVLEQAVAAHGGRAVVTCHRDLFHLFGPHGKGDQEAPALQAGLAGWERERWLRVLEPFVAKVVPVSDSGVSDGSGAGDSASEEAAWARDARAREARFGALWRYCSHRERLTLIQVAEEGFANPHQAGSVERLLEKGLLVLRPNLKLMSPAFETFVIRTAAKSEVKNWEQPEEALGWRGGRWIFGLVILGGLVFLTGTQEAWIKGATGMLTVAAGGVEALRQLLHAVQRTQQAMPA